jgi:hypothetical protein
MKSAIIWNITPCSPLSVNRRFGGIYYFHLQGRRNKFSKKPTSKQVACWFLAELISSTLKMEVICSSEISVATRRTIRRYIAEDSILYNLRCENLKS